MTSPRKRALEEQLAKEIDESEKVRAKIVAILFSLGLLVTGVVIPVLNAYFSTGASAVFPEIGRRLSTWAGILAVYCWGSWFFISRRIRFGRPLPSLFVALNTVLEVTTVTTLVWIISRTASPTFGLSAPPILLYVVLIMMSILRLNVRFSLAVAGLTAAQYLALWRLLPAPPTGSVSPFDSPIPIFLRASIFLVCGVAAGLLSRELRFRLVRAAEVVLERDRTVATFGQHVSPRVAERLLREQAGQTTEMRHVCILFLDIRDFTRFSEQRTPTEVVDFLNALFGPLVEVIDRHGGIINKFLGDGFLAVFGAPIADANPCRQAVQAALELVATVDLLSQSKVIPATRIGIGLHAGDVVTGNVGSQLRREYTVIGDVVNLASRVEQLIKSHDAKVLATAAVLSQLSEAERTAEPLPSVQVKGREAPVQIFKLA